MPQTVWLYGYWNEADHAVATLDFFNQRFKVFILAFCPQSKIYTDLELNTDRLLSKCYPRFLF
jgi:hypothetical protein